jgi:hypothetical protein
VSHGQWPAAEEALQEQETAGSSAHDKYEMRAHEFSAPKAPKKPQRIKPRKTIKPSKKSLPNTKPLDAADAMIAARKRDIEVAKMALKREKEFQRRRKELEKQRRKNSKV